LPEDRFYWAGIYESRVCEELADLIRPGSLCFDVGAHRGYISGVMALRSQGVVFAFEPLAENQKSILEVKALNPNLDIRLEGCAVGDFDGTTAFRTHSDTSMGKIAGSTFLPGDSVASELEVRITTLDTFVRSGQSVVPDVIKVDVEGGEAAVLRGARMILSRYRPKLVIEVHSGEIEEECNRILNECLYSTRRLERVARYPQHLVGEGNPGDLRGRC
jgi:FkbM family methyltransferase